LKGHVAIIARLDRDRDVHAGRRVLQPSLGGFSQSARGQRESKPLPGEWPPRQSESSDPAGHGTVAIRRVRPVERGVDS
jgi:hypothetical protein